jgi:hypothetical protein
MSNVGIGMIISQNPYEPGPNLLKLCIKPGFVNKSLQLSELDKEVFHICVYRQRGFIKATHR